MRLEYADVADVWDERANVSCRPASANVLGTPATGPSCSPNGWTLHSLLDGFGGLTGPLYNQRQPILSLLSTQQAAEPDSGL